jgi:hypothetical protein
MNAATLSHASGRDDSVEVLWEDAERIFFRLLQKDDEGHRHAFAPILAGAEHPTFESCFASSRPTWRSWPSTCDRSAMGWWSLMVGRLQARRHWRRDADPPRSIARNSGSALAARALSTPSASNISGRSASPKNTFWPCRRTCVTRYGSRSERYPVQPGLSQMLRY